MLTIAVAEQPLPALLDSNFANQATKTDSEIDHPVTQKVNFEFLTHADLQRMRELLKTYIQVLNDEVKLFKKVSHQFHEAADKNDPNTECFFKHHSFYRSRLKNSRDTLRKVEKMQRRIRHTLAHTNEIVR